MLKSVDVVTASTREERRKGLSNIAAIDDGSGMLFIHENEGKKSYVMRDMMFGLDIIFIDSAGYITEIHHAPLPSSESSENELLRYEGHGKWILEVPYKWTTRNVINIGDRIKITNYFNQYN